MGNCWPSLRRNLSPVSADKPSTAVHHNEDVFGNNSVKLGAGNGGPAASKSDAQKPPPSEQTRARNGGGEASEALDKEVPPTGRIVTPNLKMFSYAELKSATRNFRPDTLVGEGGFGRVFKGWVDEKTYAPCKVGAGIPVAVKKSNPDSSQGLKEWQAEVKFLGKFSHPNLVKLLGYCWEDRHFLLVYEYMQKGSLESHLFRKGAEPLSWERRLKIAAEAAQGLEFLHSTEKKVIYRDFKASNILLDVDFTAKLSDFGLAKLGPADGDSHVTTRIVGTYGYAAPEYIATGHLYVRSDVYGFGVVLLEILTGQRVLDMNRASGEHNLVEWARPFLPDKKKLKKIMDPGLESLYPSEAAFQAAELILKCLESDPKNRPSMKEVLETLKQIREVKMKPKELRAAQRHHQLPGDAIHNYGHARSPLHHKYGGFAPVAGRQPRSPLRRSSH